MGKTGAERQRDFRQRVNAAAVRALEAELAAALERGEQMDVIVAGLGARIDGLEAQLEQASGSADRYCGICRDCGTALACPSCQRGDEFA